MSASFITLCNEFRGRQLRARSFFTEWLLEDDHPSESAMQEVIRQALYEMPEAMPETKWNTFKWALAIHVCERPYFSAFGVLAMIVLVFGHMYHWLIRPALAWALGLHP